MIVDTQQQKLRGIADGLAHEPHFGWLAYHLREAAGTIDALRAERDMEDFDAGWLAAEARFKGQRDAARAEVARLRALLTAVRAKTSVGLWIDADELLRAALGGES